MTTSAESDAIAAKYQEVISKSQQLVSRYLANIATSSSGERNQLDSGSNTPADSFSADPFNVTQLWADEFAALLDKPELLIDAQFSWWNDAIDLWQDAATRVINSDFDVSSSDGKTHPVVPDEPGDRRFKDPAWSKQFAFNYAKQAYLLMSRYLRDVNNVAAQELPMLQRRKSEFLLKQFSDALSPTNFAMSNPQVIEETLKTHGQNLLRGLENLLNDLDAGLLQGGFAPRIRQVDESAFSLGENIATTEGAVVYENDLMQLIQYAPTTKKTFERPLLIIPPWINKYYILDLRPDNSLIRWLVSEGHTVFVISWINPDSQHSDKGFGDYMVEGPMAALDAIAQLTSARVNAVGYCIGGTLLSSTLAWMRAQDDQRICSATLLTSLIDFENPGELGIFAGEDEIEFIEKQMSETGYLDGATMANTFNLLRSTDLIWSFVINNYLLGKAPLKFDLLYWNSDSTRMPARMHSFYLRNMYLNNRLCRPGGITLKDIDIDISSITTPAFFVATREDHIAPWESCFQGAKLFSGNVDFLLAGSGHIAGVVNPPDAKKYGYWFGEALRPDSDAQAWLSSSQQVQGSWWPQWSSWLTSHAGKKVPALKPGDGALDFIEAAPGRYCKMR